MSDNRADGIECEGRSRRGERNTKLKIVKCEKKHDRSPGEKKEGEAN